MTLAHALYCVLQPATSLSFVMLLNSLTTPCCFLSKQALGDLLLPHALSTAQPHTHSSPTPLNHSLFDSSSVSHQSQCRMTSTAGASSLAAATTAKTTAHTNTSETPLSGCVRPAAVVGPQLLSPAEIATVAFCFGGGGGTETRSEQLGVGRQMQGVDSSSCESGIPFSSGAASTAVNSGHRSDQLLNQPYHHVPLFRALAAAALAPAVHSGSSLPFITTSYHTPSPPALSAVGNGESSLPDLVYHRDARCVCLSLSCVSVAIKQRLCLLPFL